jgi:hypothetical protein
MSDLRSAFRVPGSASSGPPSRFRGQARAGAADTRNAEPGTRN